MESRIAYLHKKFKKQLCIELKAQNNEEEKKDSTGVLEPSEEKIVRENYSACEQYSTVSEIQTRTDNNECVPNQSTNQNIFFVHNDNNIQVSSISVEKSKANLQSSNSCISYVKSENSQRPSNPANFDTTFSNTEPTNPTVNLSSMLENTYSNQHYATQLEDISSQNIYEEYSAKSDIDFKSEYSQEEIQPPPDRNSSGKYVCTYCNLVCSKPSVLQKHIRAHTNERPYPCISCGFSFKTRSNLYKHCRSRTHANRVMGNRAQETNNENNLQTSYGRPSPQRDEINVFDDKFDLVPQDMKSKPYKPRFHTVNLTLPPTTAEFINDEKPEDQQQINSVHANSDLLSHHINEIISKNNSIVNSNDPYLLKKRPADLIVDNIGNSEYIQRYRSDSLIVIEQRNSEEPLNLSSKNRKRCMSEVSEPTTQKSLIKELLLKNLYSDMQCPHCKMIFQTVTELELHKLRSCKGKSGTKYTRSSSVNVASILTQNKNAFDNIPQLQNTVFPLNSPGPFLGKTRLVESDKCKSFSFDDGLRSLSITSPPQEMPPQYFSSNLALNYEKEKKNSVKLFGGEVKITQTSGETKSFKIDNKESDKFETENSFIDFGGKVSENRVIKSSLQSGGTVLTNKSSFSKQERPSKDVIRVYESTSVSPSIDIISSITKSKFSFEKLPAEITTPLELRPSVNEPIIMASSLVNDTASYTNIVDFSQKAVKLLTPNLKQPAIITPTPESSSRFSFNPERIKNMTYSAGTPTSKRDVDLIAKDTAPQNLSKKIEIVKTQEKRYYEERQLPLQKRIMIEPPVPTSDMYGPMNLFVNGKVVRYVPGMPGPVAAEGTVDIMYTNTIASSDRPLLRKVSAITTAMLPEKSEQSENIKDMKSFPPNGMMHLEKPMDTSVHKPKLGILEIKTDFSPKISEIKSPKNRISEIRSPIKSSERKSPSMTTTSETKKFARPNSLALKPTTACLKQHHGLTPTMFNQILISPDTPRVAKKYEQHYLNGNYFSYLFLKSSTRPVYCTLNKTQPFYVTHFKKLSMYSEWRQQDTKTDKLFVGAYDSRQKSQRYTTAGKHTADLIVHSSYKFIVSDTTLNRGEGSDDNQKSTSSMILGGYECNEDYTYIRGRGRGRYVCEKCGIRCKKPSMLKKHIRTHSDDRPYTCNHCNFSFKTKGNLTKHMKSKAHTKNYVAVNSSCTSTQQSGTQSSESDTDDSGMDSSDESTRNQEHEAAYGLLSLSQKTSQNAASNSPLEIISTNSLPNASCSPNMSEVLMSTEEIDYVSKTNYAKNKILHQTTCPSFRTPKNISELPFIDEPRELESKNMIHFLGKTSGNRPLTYPYTSLLPFERDTKSKVTNMEVDSISNDHRQVEPLVNITESSKAEPKSIKQFHVIQKYAPVQSTTLFKTHEKVVKEIECPKSTVSLDTNQDITNNNLRNISVDQGKVFSNEVFSSDHVKVPQNINPPTLKVNDVALNENVNDLRKRKYPVEEMEKQTIKIHKNDDVIDLSMPTVVDKHFSNDRNNGIHAEKVCHNTEYNASNIHPSLKTSETYSKSSRIIQPQLVSKSPHVYDCEDSHSQGETNIKNNDCSKLSKNNGDVSDLPQVASQTEDQMVYYSPPDEQNSNSEPQRISDYDNSAMETLADIATKQVKLEKNTLAKSVATQYLKLATKNEFAADGTRDSSNFTYTNKDVNELIVKPEGSKSCTICAKSFNKPSQLKLHMNIHYLERPYRCDSCSVSFRTKGHLQKHERSASHHNKLSTSPALSSSEPRPFKCSDCNIAFRIHGHLAKHLRAKMHIMKLECLAKIPFGLYAELERSNSLLTEINTFDGDQCLESLRNLAKKVFSNDPSKLNDLEETKNIDVDS